MNDTTEALAVPAVTSEDVLTPAMGASHFGWRIVGSGTFTPPGGWDARPRMRPTTG